MKIAVITPYYREDPEILKRCVDSVKVQTRACEHILVADGFPQNWLQTSGVRHIALDKSHGDYGNTPRGLGAQLAVSSGFDAVTFLDADNWYDPDHIETCVSVVQAAGEANLDVVAAKRRFIKVDGKVADVPDENNHIDTNCYFLLRSAFSVIPVWNLMPKELSSIGDRIFYRSVAARQYQVIDTPKKTVNYLTMWPQHYLATGDPVPEGARPGVGFKSIIAWYESLQEDRLEELHRIFGYKVRFDKPSKA